MCPIVKIIQVRRLGMRRIVVQVVLIVRTKGEVRYSAVQCSTVRYSAVQCGTVRYSVWYSVICT